MAITLKSLEIFDAQNNLVANHALDAEVKSKQEDIGYLLQSLLNLSHHTEKRNLRTKLTVNLDDSNSSIVIDRRDWDNFLQIELDGAIQNADAYTLFSEQTGLKIDSTIWVNRFLDFHRENIQTSEDISRVFLQRDSTIEASPQLEMNRSGLESQIEAAKTQIAQGLNDEQRKKIDRLIEVKISVSKLEKVIDNYQKKKNNSESLNSEIKKIEQEVKLLDEKLSSVQSLINAKEKIAQELGNFNNNVVKDNNVIDQIKLKRQQDLQSRLSGVFTHPTKKNEISEQKRRSFQGVEVLIIIVSQIILTLVFLILSSDFKYLVPGFISLFVLLTAIFLINITKSEAEEKIELFTQEKPQIRSVIDEGNFDQNRMFIENAWVQAYLQEQKRIDDLITNNLNNRSYEELEREKNDLNRKLLQKRREQDGGGDSLSVDEYYKKRRELDILKIEKEDLEFNLKLPTINDSGVLGLVSQLNDLEDKIANAEDNKNQLPFITINATEKIKEELEKLTIENQVILINKL